MELSGLDASDKIAIVACVVAILAAAVSIWQAISATSQARTAKGQAESAEDQANSAREQADTAKDQLEVARQQLEQARQAQREQSEPYVIVDIQPYRQGTGVLVLVIENIGPTVARNVQVSCEPPLTSHMGSEVDSLLGQALARTIPMLPPKRRLEFLFDDANRFREDNALPTAYHFTVRSKGPYGPVEELEYTVDFAAWKGALVGQRPTKQLEDNVNAVSKQLKKLTDKYVMANSEAIRVEQHRLRDARRAQFGDADGPEDGSGRSQ